MKDTSSSRRGARAASVLPALRLFGLIPEPEEAKLQALAPRWRGHGRQLDGEGMFLALAIGELAPIVADALRLLSPESGGAEDADLRRAWGKLVRSAAWRAEVEPVRALAALGLAFGAAAAHAWLSSPDEAGRLVLDGVFRGDAAKLAHASRQALGSPG